MASGETEHQRTVSSRCWSVILTCEASEGRINVARMPSMPYSYLTSCRIQFDLWYFLYSRRFLIDCDSNTFYTIQHFKYCLFTLGNGLIIWSIFNLSHGFLSRTRAPVAGYTVRGCFPEIPGRQICDNYLIFSACLFFFCYQHSTRVYWVNR